MFMVRQGSVRDIRYRGYEIPVNQRTACRPGLDEIPLNPPGTNFSSLFPGIKPHLLTLGKTFAALHLPRFLKR
jgi:hypothetical protein